MKCSHHFELGNFAVTYRVSGFLEEPKRLISARSNLYTCVLDTLHRDGIEIMSPSFMHQRKLGDNARIIPSTIVRPTSDNRKSSAEDIAFDKADRAEALEKKLEGSIKQLSNDEEKKAQQETIEQMQKRLKSFEEISQKAESESDTTESRTARDEDSSPPHPHQ